jgi:nicotinamidase-related amidase
MTIRGLDKSQKAALLISECQVGIVDAAFADTPLAHQVKERNTLRNIAALADLCRTHGIPVVHCTIVPRKQFEGFVVNCVLNSMIFKGGRLQAGDEHAAIHPLLIPHENDIVSERCHGISAFHGTELESVLRGYGINTVILAGVSTNIALPGMATEAVNRLFEVVLAEDCTAGGTAESHEAQIRLHLPLLATITSYEKLKVALEARTQTRY